MGATYSARDAARRVGLSDAAVRRAIASGRINPTQVDGMWRLTDDDLATLRALRRSRIDARRRTTDAAATSQGDAPASVTHPDALIAMIERQQQQLIEMGRQIGLLQAQLQAAEQEIRLLKAPSATVVANGEQSPDPALAETAKETANGLTIEQTRQGGESCPVSEGARQSWWRRALAWATQPM